MPPELVALWRWFLQTPGWRGLVLGLVAAFLSLGFFLGGALKPLDRVAFNSLFHLRGERKPASPVVLVVVDDKTIARAGRVPLPRGWYAGVVERLTAAGAQAIAFDLLFDVPADAEGDRQLAEACQKSGRVVQGVSFDVASAQGLKTAIPPRFALGDDGGTARVATGFAGPMPPLEKSARALGHMNIQPEEGGDFRRIPHLLKLNGQLCPSLALATAAQGIGIEPGLITAQNRAVVLHPRGEPEIRVPLDEHGDTYVNWVGGHDVFPTCTFNDLLDGKVRPQTFKGAVVLIGAINSGAFTPISTPFSNLQSSLELQANAIDDILARRPLLEAAFSWQIALCLLGAALLGALTGPRGAVGALAWLFVGSAFLWAGAWASLKWLNFLWPLAAPQLGLILTSAACLGVRQVREGRDLKHVTAVFGAYVGPEILHALGGKMPEMGGEIRYVAVLFCDIQGFSGLSEQLQDRPAELLALLNEHFNPLIDLLKHHRAFVDNYVGDLVMAIFGAPTDEESPDATVRRAALAAIDLMETVDERNRRWKAEGRPPIEVGIGLHCGPALVGNLGSEARMHYTAIGDTVNIASRVESATRTYDTPLLVTEAVVRACEGHRETEHLKWIFADETQVKGRMATVRLYKIAGARRKIK